MKRAILSGLAIEGIALGALAAVWVLIGGGASLIFRATQCPHQPLHQPCTFQVRQ